MPEHPNTRPTSYADTESVLDLAHRLKRHTAKGDQPRRCMELHAQAQAFGAKILVECPPGRERDRALAHLDVALMMAVAAIARGEADRGPANG